MDDRYAVSRPAVSRDRGRVWNGRRPIEDALPPVPLPPALLLGEANLTFPHSHVNSCSAGNCYTTPRQLFHDSNYSSIPLFRLPPCSRDNEWRVFAHVTSCFRWNKVPHPAFWRIWLAPLRKVGNAVCSVTVVSEPHAQHNTLPAFSLFCKACKARPPLL
ncbi:hypothetical protein J6590_042981 [Homalodisca vitripennis]|nr:hypothetical protein J6590_042981 [Homalodisca vitripennis]